MDSKDYWNKRYQSGGNSGYGSYNLQLTRKLRWLSGLDIKTISEIGCGDFHFAKNLLTFYPDASYAGYDISDVIIEKNKKDYPQYFFSNKEIVGNADLLLCIDVLFHVLDDEELEAMLNILENTWTKYLAITAYERDEPKSNHVRIRKFDYKRFGEPILRSIVEEDGELYFYLFKKF